MEVVLCIASYLYATVSSDFEYQQLDEHDFYLLDGDFVTSTQKRLNSAVIAGSGHFVEFWSTQPFNTLHNVTISHVTFSFYGRFCDSLVDSVLYAVRFEGNFSANALTGTEMTWVSFAALHANRMADVRITFFETRSLQVEIAIRTFFGYGVVGVYYVPEQDCMLFHAATGVYFDGEGEEDYQYLDLAALAGVCHECRIVQGQLYICMYAHANTATKVWGRYLTIETPQCRFFDAFGCLHFCGMPATLCNSNGRCQDYACKCERGYLSQTNCIAQATDQAGVADALFLFLMVVLVCTAVALGGAVISSNIARRQTQAKIARLQTTGQCWDGTLNSGAGC